MATSTRQPFGEIGSSRLQVLQSAKNRQNANAPNFTSPQSLKSIPTPSTGKRQRAPEIYEDADSENMDPSVFSSPTKKSKTANHHDAGYIEPANFSIFTSPVKPSSVSLNATPSVLSVRKTLSSPNTAKSTPITNSRGSPKNKRLHAISKRRASTSPFRRVDPPSFAQSSPRLPFSIDAALSGSLSTYTPKAPITVAATPVSAPSAQQAPVLDDSMPKSWFFDIHEDTPEQEAANLMEHSASVLDISSDDDDAATKSRNEDRGKENVPPPDFLAAANARKRNHASSLDDGYETDILVDVPPKQPRRMRKFVHEAMDEDRRPLGDLAPSEFYADGCDATSYVTVDAVIDKPSGLSKEFDASCVTPEEKNKKKKHVVVAQVPAGVDTETETAVVPKEVVATPAIDTTPQSCQVPAAAS